MYPTKEQFWAYEEVRREGRFNMFDKNARLLSGLSKDVYFAVIKNYTQLAKKHTRKENL